jgi:hypothetical protein
VLADDIIESDEEEDAVGEYVVSVKDDVAYKLHNPDDVVFIHM